MENIVKYATVLVNNIRFLKNITETKDKLLIKTFDKICKDLLKENEVKDLKSYVTPALFEELSQEQKESLKNE
jgi:hypothetical protein